jgi:hypothetical protein
MSGVIVADDTQFTGPNEIVQQFFAGIRLYP